MRKLFMATFVLSFGLFLSQPTFAEGTPTDNAIAVNTTMNNATNTTHAYATDNRNNNNWGWLGLAGLLGLAGMRNRSKDPQK
ncbi:WGxxGxxG family protein [Paenibacillus ginsengarvi]|nr:WGxxGxxG family protein [Paenibacillus ginsengarvi]